ncbi:GNAT family N-acetyltransferase [Paenibacillus guangzhouensis]|uniref:GNAT family N-acetyltransferase n=1 Tax=Paenibacillus guangzhouensis TaxID=1473112 RepID=UPI001D119A09|nr:N-acetyltransferase [Paenibacillus guangzhouensis]
MENIIIRHETNQDWNDVYHVVEAAFRSEEHTDHDEHNLVNRLRSSANFIPELSLVAVDGDRIVGHIMFTEIKVDDHTLIALAPLAVSPEMQSRGIGRILIMEAHNIAAKLGYKGSVVLGHDKYYPKFGYQKASQYGIKAPFEVSDDHFMALELIPDGLADIHGTVEYAKAFFEK